MNSIRETTASPSTAQAGESDNGSRAGNAGAGWRLDLATIIIAGLILLLPLMVGRRSAESIALATLVLVAASAVVAWLTLLPGRWRAILPWPSPAWWWFAGAFTVAILLQVLPSTSLARWFGPYPDAMLDSPVFAPAHWSPNPSATLLGWASFVGLFVIAWVAGQLNRQRRMWLWLALLAAVMFQVLYGLIAQGLGAHTVFGIWQRAHTGFVQGSFSNRNLYAGYLAALWPLAVAIWWWPGVPLLSRLPLPLRFAGSLLAAAAVGVALVATASRLGAVAGMVGAMVWLLLWRRQRGGWHGPVRWLLYPGAAVVGLIMVWYGLTPLAERLVVTSAEESRLLMYVTMVSDMPASWWLSGVGLGGFEAAFRQVQPADMVGWYDHAHSDLLQWLLEMGVVGAVLLLVVVVAVLRSGLQRSEQPALYAGLAALCVVGLGDFSWHMPATQLVAALFLGTLLAGRERPERTQLPALAKRPAPARKSGRSHPVGSAKGRSQGTHRLQAVTGQTARATRPGGG
ncbi:MAG: O-antigen ligase family protein [Xanthomonadales bacterium]|nr:O-antigen ligase family protein [Xanthomonadales bacterium]